MQYNTTTILIMLTGLSLAPFVASEPLLRPCGFKIAPCPSSWTCSRLDPECTRGENCAGVCVPSTAATFTTSVTAVTATAAVPLPSTYQSCGGRRAQPVECPEDHICMDDPRRGGCGMACDAPGICVLPVACGSKTGLLCASGKMCVDDPRDDCWPEEGGKDCSGVCV